MTIIRVIDFETTGLEPPAEVIEVGYCDLIKPGHDATLPWVVDDPVAFFCGAKSVPPETRAVHHISPSDVAGLEPFDGAEFIEQGDSFDVIAAHNWAFEAQWMTPDITGRIPAICTMKAALRVWPDAPSHSNGVLRYWLEEKGLTAPSHEKTMPPHRAGPDAYVTAWLLKALLEAGATGKEMVAWTKEPRLFPTCPIGEKWRGKPWSEVDGGFLGWMMRQPGMEDDLKWNAQREIDRRSQGHAK